MKELLEKTIPGVEFDSSDRDPPPRCHPGTRLAILKRCLSFILFCDGQKKMRWVVGAAGVGKSAVMQSVAEFPELPVSCHPSVFFSINGRNDGTKAIITISYQLAVKSKSYRQLIKREITLDPSLLRLSMAKQFLKLIIVSFIHNSELNSANHVLIIIDGLDECNDSCTQLELLRLISDLCIKHPSSPLEEIPVNSSEARADAERFLRTELTKIKEASKDPVDPRWPEEQDFWELTNASGGLFAYAHMAIRYIGDSTVRSPASQLSDVLNVIDNHPITNGPREEHPMALPDALYLQSSV
ncbi:hypothetical protein AGABI1DRAFT_132529 [Agaricus bisporus var. burnettii JB137-S8]|uniref:Nephrocystin 3-like N-terminal domain-containing protein n=1 Tax=Agaricus bisporus var. burnettii (strain JB137-S8 / ATCC MYA-4627 / FGSC 10392) TaxID=597362 RepID=K5WWK3_AGABU|nr:uncharacterized protein AGABI1DRAFT_132529 [Agaricus bisporus var. burnettii JB137-S8]EKM75178.1 hypothetical protein AGABI1DRAFT_132529 [Agaricus bisporus var. burnettii JB137-S8]